MAGKIKITHRGDFNNTKRFFSRASSMRFISALHEYGRRGVHALSAYTPEDTGLTAASWGYNIVQEPGRIVIQWTNSHVNQGVLIAILIQYGHATRNGGFVQGRDFINPAMRPIFDGLASEAWLEVTSA